MAFSIATVIQHQQGSRCLGSVGLCVLCVLTMAYCVSISHSIVLMLALWISVFALCSLLSALYSMTITHRPTERYSYGLARVPVLAVFSTTVLAQLFSIFLSKESFEHLLSPDHHGSHDGGAHEHETDHIGSFPYYLGAVASSISLLLSAYALKNQPFQYVLISATSSSLQEHAADLSQAICYVVPGLSRLLLPRINAMVLLAITSSGLLLLCDHFRTDFAWADPVCCLVLCVAVFSTMWPLSSYTGMILLQTAPPHLLNQIDRCISEASTIDGVLEIKTGHFWQLDFSQLVGSVDVRVRRDADEQKVLVMVTEKLSSVLNTLTVQIVKDAGWQSSPNMGSMAVEQDHGHHGHSHDDGHGHSHDHSDHGHSHDGVDDHHGHSHSAAPLGYGSGYTNQGYANQGYGTSQQQQQQQQDYNAYWQQQQQAAAWQQYQQQQQQAQQNHGHSHGADGEHHGHSHDGVTYH